jgi:hypothetical protein
MKRILSLACAIALCVFVSTEAFSATCGAYLGLGLGKSWVKTPDSNLFIVPAGGSVGHELSGFAGRAFFGFNVNRYFGIEGGYTRYARSNYTGYTAGNNANLRYYIHTYDAVVKGYLPLGYSGFNAYALAGIARVVETIIFNNPGLIPMNTNIATPSQHDTHGYNNREIYGLGINYNFTRHLTVNAEVTQIQKLNNFSNTPTAVPFLDLATLNFAYNFG